jgi:pheromone shutdown protein TraB
VCGGPRIPPTESPISEAEAALLRSARSEQLRSGAFRAGAGFVLGSGVLALLVASVVLLATSPAAFATAAALFACLVPFALSLFALRRARGHARALDTALQQAWLLAASRVVAQRSGQVDAAALARALRIDEARAELLLAEVSVQNFVQSPAELPARVRVTELADDSDRADAAEAARPRADVSKP